MKLRFISLTTALAVSLIAGACTTARRSEANQQTSTGRDTTSTTTKEAPAPRIYRGKIERISHFTHTSAYGTEYQKTAVKFADYAEVVEYYTNADLALAQVGDTLVVTTHQGGWASVKLELSGKQ